MTAADFKALPTPPTDRRPELVALWHDAQGNWARAHETVQDIETDDAAWVHAYLHRKEDDISNARYWYSRAHQPVFAGPLDDEWTHIATTLLAQRSR